MNILKQILGAFTAPPMTGVADRGMYYYVRCNRCGEVVRLRIDPMNDLSWNDDHSGKFVRKLMVGKRCYSRIEGEFDFDKNRKLREARISGGDMVDKAAYEADQQAHPPETP